MATAIIHTLATGAWTVTNCNTTWCSINLDLIQINMYPESGTNNIMEEIRHVIKSFNRRRKRTV